MVFVYTRFLSNSRYHFRRKDESLSVQWLSPADFGKQDSCTDGTCYQAKVDAHVAKAVAAKPNLAQISTGYMQPQQGPASVKCHSAVEGYLQYFVSGRTHSDGVGITLREGARTMQNTKEIHNEQPAKGSPSQPAQGNPTHDKNAAGKQGQSGPQMPPKVHDDLKRQDQQKTEKR